MICAGQTCNAPDYILVHENVKDIFVYKTKKTIEKFFGKDILNNETYPKIINKNHFNRLIDYLQEGKIIYGGNSDFDKLKIEPTLIELDSYDSPLMDDEIYGPILPIISFKNIGDIKKIISMNKNPLDLYLFTESEELSTRLISSISFGGGCINDTVIHVTNPYLPIGGVMKSGQGRYHGKFSIDTFSNFKSVVKSSTKFDRMIKYPPYSSGKFHLIKRIIK